MTDRPISETVAPGEAGDVIPSDPQALAEDIERTRERLGETVGALTAKLDVPARARDKVSQVKDRIADKTGDVKGKIADKAGDVKGKIADQTGKIADKTGDVKGATGDVTSQIADKAGPLRQQISTKTAPIVRAARQRPVPYAVAAGAVLLLGVWLSRAIKRR